MWSINPHTSTHPLSRPTARRSSTTLRDIALTSDLSPDNMHTCIYQRVIITSYSSDTSTHVFITNLRAGFEIPHDNIFQTRSNHSSSNDLACSFLAGHHSKTVSSHITQVTSRHAACMLYARAHRAYRVL